MTIKLYSPGVSQANKAISNGDINRSSRWSMSSTDENRILGDPPDWTKYGAWHLGKDSEAEKDTKAGWRYPFGKGGKLYRSALTAIRQRAGQQGHDDIFEAAGRLLAKVDKDEDNKAMKWYDIKAQGNSAEIWLYGDIAATDFDNPFSNEITAKAFIDELNAFQGTDITLRINSRGGGVHQGMAIYQALLRHPAQVHAEIDVIAGSISSVIPMAADYVTIADTAQIMIHDPWTEARGNSAEFRKLADDMDTIREGMVKAYMRRWKGSREELLEALGKESLYSAEQAVELGLADDVFTGDLRVAAHFEGPLHEVERAEAERIVDLPQVQSNTGTKGNETMTTEAKGAGPETNIADLTAKVLEKDRARRDSIAGVFAKFPSYEGLMRECQDRQSCTADEARALLLEKVSEGAEPLGTSARIDSGEDAKSKFKKGVQQWLYARTGHVEHKDLIGNEYRGYTLVDIARACCEFSGVDVKGRDRMGIVKAAISGVGGHSVDDFDNLLEDTLNKTLMESYRLMPDTWRSFCSVGEVSDFRAHSRLKLGSFSNLDTVAENAEFTYGTVGDAEKETITATTKGKLLTLSRQAMVNDDLGAFNSAAQMMGRAAARTIEADVYALLALNSNLGPTLTDGNTLFHANHSNTGTGGAITAASVDEARQLMASQTDPGGNDYLDIRAAVLLVGEALRATAIKIIGAEYDPDETSAIAQGIPNPVRNMVTVVSSARMPATIYYFFASPQDTPTIEVAFLNGNQTPFLDQETGFNIDGITYKVRLDYGVGAVDYRGAVYNAGA